MKPLTEREKALAVLLASCEEDIIAAFSCEDKRLRLNLIHDAKDACREALDILLKRED